MLRLFIVLLVVGKRWKLSCRKIRVQASNAIYGKLRWVDARYSEGIF